MKFLITGSSGFIGFHLAKKLLQQGHDVVGIDNHNDYYDISIKKNRKKLLETEKFKFFQQDLNNLNISESNFDFAINLAAQAGVRVPKDKEYLYEHSNSKGFEKFCEFCEFKDIKKIIYASSSAVYSDIDTEIFTEGVTKLNPKSIYGLSKLSNEKFASMYAGNKEISIVGLRFFSVYGPFGRPDMAYYSFAKAINDGTSLVLNNNGSMQRDMTYIDDVVDGIQGAINYINHKKSAIKNEIFNLGNNVPILTSTLLDVLQKKLKKKAYIEHMQTENESLITHADITKAKNLLGYDPKISFENGIDLFLKWYKSYENK